jgi:F0F1-type ATP synthase assembly protein I
LFNNQLKFKKMKLIQDTTAKIKANPISTLGGAVAGFYLAKKFLPASKWYMVGGIVIGAIGGAMVSSAIASRKSAPKKDQVTAPAGK